MIFRLAFTIAFAWSYLPSCSADDKLPASEVGSCEAIAGVFATEGEYIDSVSVDGVVTCEIECMKRKDCVSFILDSATGEGTCTLYSTDGDAYTVGSDNTYGHCTKPSLNLSKVYIMNNGLGGYLSSRDINPLLKRDGKAWEEWTIEKSNDKYAIKDYRGRYLSGQWSGLVEFRDWLDEWEKWEIKRVGDDTVTIKSHHGKYLKAEGSGWVLANAGAANAWEKWSITNNNDIEGSGPDGETTLTGTVLIPVAILVAVATGGVTAPALIAAGVSVTTAVNIAAAAAIANQVALLLIGVGFQTLLAEGLKIEPSATRAATAPVAYAALFDE